METKNSRHGWGSHPKELPSYRASKTSSSCGSFITVISIPPQPLYLFVTLLRTAIETAISEVHQLLPAISEVHELLPAISEVHQLLPAISEVHQLLPAISEVHQLLPAISEVHQLLRAGGVPTSLTLLFWRWMTVSSVFAGGSARMSYSLVPSLPPPPLPPPLPPPPSTPSQKQQQTNKTGYQPTSHRSNRL